MSSNHPVDYSDRNPTPGVLELIYKRWSPRSFADTPVSQEQLQQIFDAARWAPSCYNAQPWKFITSTASSHKRFLSLLVEGNQAWAQSAPVIGFVIAERQFAHNGNENKHAGFDTGAACMAMSLQAHSLGLNTHFMAGIEYEAVYEAFELDKSRVEVICGFTLGTSGDPKALSETLQAKEKPSPRKTLSDIWTSVD